jgi:hypothetical protein
MKLYTNMLGEVVDILSVLSVRVEMKSDSMFKIRQAKVFLKVK